MQKQNVRSNLPPISHFLFIFDIRTVNKAKTSKTAFK
jgi:hypothetical protein